MIPRLGSMPFTTAALLVSTLAVVIHAVVMHREGWPPIHPTVVKYGIWMGIVSTVIPTYLINYSIRNLGASNASLVATLGPVTTIGLAYIFLGERLTALQWLGSLLVIVGVVVISVRGKISLSRCNYIVLVASMSILVYCIYYSRYVRTNRTIAKTHRLTPEIFLTILMVLSVKRGLILPATSILVISARAIMPSNEP